MGYRTERPRKAKGLMPDVRTTPASPGIWPVFFVRGCVAGLVLAVVLEFSYTLVGSNFRTVAPGLVYRCAKLSTGGLEDAIKRHGIRTVINLCGCCDPVAWYRDEARTLNRL